MLPGPTIIRKCSFCSKLISQYTISSGNTFGARFWTDGKREAPMLPDEPWLVMCPHCDAPVWIDELEEIGKVDPLGELDRIAEDAITYRLPTCDEYFLLLEKKVKSKRKERHIRLHAWWASNDARRIQETEVEISERAAANLRAFAVLLKESDPNDLVMKAEIKRELGCFEEAMALLERSDDDDMSEVVSIMKSLVEKKDRYVREIQFT